MTFRIEINRCISVTAWQILKTIRNTRVTDFKAAVFLKQFFDSYMEVVQVSRVNLTIPDGGFKAEVLNVYKAEPPEAIR